MAIISYIWTENEVEHYGELRRELPDGRLVIEVGASGNYRVMRPDQVERVVPYTILVDIWRPTGYHTRGHYTTTNSTLVPGDILHSNDPKDPAHGMVVEIDTEEDDAPNLKGFVKVVTQAV